MRKAILSTNQRRVLPVFLKPGITKDLCKEANIETNTYYKWMQNKAWREALEQYETQAASDARKYIKSLYSDAAEKLHGLLNSKYESMRFKAVSLILEYQFKYTEQDNIIKKVDELEARLNAQEKLNLNPVKDRSSRSKAPAERST